MMRDINRIVQKSLLLAIGATLLLAVGCGKTSVNQGEVSGAVTLDGKPIEQGSIVFVPIEGTKGTVTGGKIAEGRYQLSGAAGVAAGWNRVEIRAMRRTGRKVPKPFSQHGETVEEQAEAVSPRFNSASTLKIEVKPGENTANFDVSSR